MGDFNIPHVTQFTKKKTIVPLSSYDASTDTIIDVRGMNRKAILVQNTGSTGATGTYSILASIDEMQPTTGVTGAATFEARASARQTPNVDWDITHLGDTGIAPGAQSFVEFTNNYSLLKVRVKNAGIATMVVKAIAATN